MLNHGEGADTGKTSATSLLMKGVAATDAEREKEAKTKEARLKAKLAITGGKAADEAGASSGEAQPKKLSFGEYMSRARGEKSPALLSEVGERTDTVRNTVSRGVSIKRGKSSAAVGPSPVAPTPGRLQPSPSFANDVKALTAAVHQRRSGGQVSPTRGGEMSPSRAGILPPLGASRTRVDPSPGAGDVKSTLGE